MQALPVQSKSPTAPSLPASQKQDLQKFQEILAGVIKKLIIIFGTDITYARLSHIPEISFNPDKSIRSISGNPEEITHILLTLFTSLSQESITSRVLPLLDIDPSLPATKETHS